MSIPSWLVLNTYVAILSIVLLGMTLSKKSGTRQDSSFVFMLSVILILLIADSFIDILPRQKSWESLDLLNITAVL